MFLVGFQIVFVVLGYLVLVVLGPIPTKTLDRAFGFVDGVSASSRAWFTRPALYMARLIVFSFAAFIFVSMVALALWNVMNGLVYGFLVLTGFVSVAVLNVTPLVLFIESVLFFSLQALFPKAVLILFTLDSVLDVYVRIVGYISSFPLGKPFLKWLVIKLEKVSSEPFMCPITLQEIDPKTSLYQEGFVVQDVEVAIRLASMWNRACTLSVPFVAFPLFVWACILIPLKTFSRIIVFLKTPLKWSAKTVVFFCFVWPVVGFLPISFQVKVVLVVYNWLASFVSLFHSGVFVPVLKTGKVSPALYEGFLVIIYFPAFVLLRLAFEWQLLILSHKSPRAHNFTPSRKKWGAVWTATMSSLSRSVEDFSLPARIRSIPYIIDVDGLNRMADTLRSIGFPFVPTFKIPEPSEEDLRYPDFHIGMASIKRGLDSIKIFENDVAKGLAEFAPAYFRTESYWSDKNVLDSTSRYFIDPTYDFPDLPVSELWEVVKPIYQASRLTSPYTILKKWNKKYSLGFGIFEPGTIRKFKRSKFIAKVGMPEFKRMWWKMIEFAQTVPALSEVFPKAEALPPKKFFADKIRTVIGVPLMQHALVTIMTHWPNHNFQFLATPVKVGIPTNGYGLNKMFERHMAFDLHSAGDCTAFDSTLTGKILELITEVRKKGYEFHKDHEAICKLLDKHYATMQFNPLGVSSSGKIYRKGTGLTTGHSSTTSDNSLGMIILYLMAWRELTGLSSRQFKMFNELSVYGDDHVLSTSVNSPPTWTFVNIQKAMLRWGIVLREEVPTSRDITTIPFLSKYVKKPSLLDIEVFNRLSLPIPTFVVYHDTLKLLGKFKAPLRNKDAMYMLKRANGYLGLTAHQYSTYIVIRNAIESIQAKITIQDRLAHEARLRKGKKSTLSLRDFEKVKSYDEIVRDWWKDTYTQPSEYIEAEELQGDVDGDAPISYGAIGIPEKIFVLLSLIPDFTDPRAFNVGVVNFVQNLLAPHITWPLNLLSVANSTVTPGHLKSILVKTPYQFLNPDLTLIPDYNMHGTNLIRHYIFMSFRSKGKPSIWYSITRLLTKGTASFVFGVSARVMEEIVRFDFNVWDHFLLVMLAYIPNTVFSIFVHKVAILADFVPNLSFILDDIIQLGLTATWRRMPTSFQPILPLVSSLSIEPKRRILVVAGTGTGKSTALVEWLHYRTLLSHEKIFLIEPRSILVTSLSAYLKSGFGLPVTGATTGLEPDWNARIVVLTPQEAFIHMDKISRKSMLIFDEVHISEPVYDALLALYSITPRTIFGLTATPPSDVSAWDTVVELPLPQLFKVDEGSFNLDPTLFGHSLIPAYIAYVKQKVSSSMVRGVWLVFLPDKAHVENAVNTSTFKAVGLTGETAEHFVIPKDTRVIFSTSVADAGLTLPNVIGVITLDIDRRVVSTAFDVAVGYSKLDPKVLKQRRGRTGRTSNGVFEVICTDLFAVTLVDVESDYSKLADLTDFITGLGKLKVKSSGKDLMASLARITGGPTSVMTEFYGPFANVPLPPILNPVSTVVPKAHIDYFTLKYPNQSGDSIRRIVVNAFVTLFQNRYTDIEMPTNTSAFLEQHDLDEEDFAARTRNSVDTALKASLSRRDFGRMVGLMDIAIRLNKPLVHLDDVMAPCLSSNLGVIGTCVEHGEEGVYGPDLKVYCPECDEVRPLKRYTYFVLSGHLPYLHDGVVVGKEYFSTDLAKEYFFSYQLALSGIAYDSNPSHLKGGLSLLPFLGVRS